MIVLAGTDPHIMSWMLETTRGAITILFWINSLMNSSPQALTLMNKVALIMMILSETTQCVS